MKLLLSSILTIPLFLLLGAGYSQAQSQAKFTDIKQARIQQIQTLLNVSPKQAMLMQEALSYKLPEIWALKKGDSQSALQLQILLAQRKVKIDSVMTPAQQELFAQKQKQINAEALALMKQRSAQTLERLRHPLSGGTYKPVTNH